jgi:hypothetical protein
LNSRKKFLLEIFEPLESFQNELWDFMDNENDKFLDMQTEINKYEGFRHAANGYKQEECPLYEMAREKSKVDLQDKYGGGEGNSRNFGMQSKEMLWIKSEKGGSIKVKVTAKHRLALMNSSKFGDEDFRISADRIMTLKKKGQAFIA